MINNKDEFFITDAYLSRVVTMLNQTEDMAEDTGISMTVSFSGTVVSGTAIGKRAFFRLVTEAFLLGETTATEEEKQKTAQFMNPFAGPLTPEQEEEIAEAEKLPPQFIHLKDAVIYTGTREIQDALWRGKLSEVSGFSFGTIRHTK
jgi:hypothetical protein